MRVCGGRASNDEWILQRVAHQGDQRHAAFHKTDPNHGTRGTMSCDGSIESSSVEITLTKGPEGSAAWEGRGLLSLF